MMSRRSLALFGSCTAGTAWVMALAVEAATRLISNALAGLGSDLPSPTLLTISIVKAHLPWVFASAATIALAIVWRTSSAWFLRASAMIALASAISCTVAVISLALPFQLCDDTWPAWSDARPPAQASPKVPGATQGPARSCR